jgi:hypothetical protein
LRPDKKDEVGSLDLRLWKIDDWERRNLVEAAQFHPRDNADDFEKTRLVEIVRIDSQAFADRIFAWKKLFRD